MENLSANSDGQTHKLPDDYLQKLKTLEAQVTFFALIFYHRFFNSFSAKLYYISFFLSHFLDFIFAKLFLQIINLKKKQENQVQLLKQKQRSDEAAKKLQDEIQFIKAQKVVLSTKYLLSPFKSILVLLFGTDTVSFCRFNCNIR